MYKSVWVRVCVIHKYTSSLQILTFRDMQLLVQLFGVNALNTSPSIVVIYELLLLSYFSRTCFVCLLVKYSIVYADYKKD